MAWTTRRELVKQLTRLWERGDLLRPLAGGEDGFPVRLTFKRPSSAELTDRFQAVRDWAGALTTIPHLRIEWREVRHRVHGLQRLPEQVWVDSLDDALALLGKAGDARRFAQLVDETQKTLPVLLPWLAKRPLHALQLTEDWPQLLAVVRWMAAHPRPGIYLRQVDIPGVHSKFIEHHRAVLSELFDLALPPQAIHGESTGLSQFNVRYGFRDKPVRIRFRVLDGAIGSLPGAQLADLTLDADNFARLNLPVRRVFITENEINFLAFPPAQASLVIFGAGYGWEALSRARWLEDCAIHYWGDIDTHGFAILDQLRSHFPHVESLLMDRATLMAHEALWGEEASPLRHDLPRLHEAERALYHDLRDGRIRPGLRLEQERIRFAALEAALRKMDVSAAPG
ncbi:MAG: Wadjet anti-phage system protein JetD domain-containing protein [Thiohalomonadaceae bacterium]